MVIAGHNQGQQGNVTNHTPCSASGDYCRSIDFIVAVIDPQKHETILDPAGGTPGSWAEHTVGYDISPQMVRIAKVNLYLTHRQEPKVEVYDTLTCEEKWNNHYDVILANPPFMSSEGGIKPHRRFFTNSRRSEALFVDYMVANDGYDLGAQRRPISENDLPAVAEEVNEYLPRRPANRWPTSRRRRG